ncbi:DELTA-actitoxin-Aeq1b-like [Trematomus bernacchii]|uniref:DELTA-actitoxin-Aeq1b-like n=1 Tax=Trematomus bernacchii TaxID=40690 RepID=UPI00146CFF0F|nr:DELTA-actitoxin-Aeq1b-like [Trematomus bernacchii]
MGAAGSTFRQCDIEIVNECPTYTFVNPRTYIYSGNCATPFPSTIAPGASGSALFSKYADAATGCVGLLTYDLLNEDTNQTAEKIAVMFSAPFNFNFYSNLYAVGVFNLRRACEVGLYEEMYYGEQTTFRRRIPDGSSLCYVGDHITIMATMSDSYQPVIKMQVSQNKK